MPSNCWIIISLLQTVASLRMISIKILVIFLYASSAYSDPVKTLRRKRARERAIDFSAHHDVTKMVLIAERDFTKHTFTQTNRPTITYTIETKGGVEILHSLTATLTKKNIPAPGSPGPSHKNGFEKRMSDLSKKEKDELGHVLAHSLGGPNELFNFVPQHSRTNRNLNKTEDEYSYWNQTEGLIRYYLIDSTVKEIVWKAIMMYDGSLNDEKNRRPA